MLIKIRVRVADGGRVERIIRGLLAQLIDTDAAVDERERTGPVRSAAIGEDGGEVFVGELDHARELVEPDAAALTEQRMVVTAVEVDAATRELIKIHGALLVAQKD